MRRNWLTAIAVLGLLGCADDTEPGDEPIGDPRPALDVRTPLHELPAECRGFEVAGLQHSPGGSVLPNLCAPFDTTHNNPYAIRCVDADPTYKTQFMGDEYCILPPPPELGMQVHIGPKNHKNADDYGTFLLGPGEEVNTYYYAKGSNRELRYFYRTNWRMRDGSHHLIVTMLPTDRADGWDSMPDRGRADLGAQGMPFGGSQRTDTDRPTGTLEIPSENRGIGGQMRPQQQFAFNLHHMNRFDQPILREVWMNVWYMRLDQVDKPMQGMQLLGNRADVQVAPGERRVLHYASSVIGRPRIIAMFGHRHANTDRFGIWIERKSGERISAYESFEYTDMPVYQYDTISKNPAPSLEHRIDGGHSGLLELSEGDTLHFVCDIENRSNVTLQFVNELFTGEMCIVFGSTTGEGAFNNPVRILD